MVSLRLVKAPVLDRPNLSPIVDPIMTVDMPVTIPENPAKLALEVSIDSINSVIGFCANAITLGVTEVEYPIPPLFIVTDVIVPFVIFAVATAVDPIPVAIGDTFIGTGGCEI